MKQRGAVKTVSDIYKSAGIFHDPKYKPTHQLRGQEKEPQYWIGNPPMPEDPSRDLYIENLQ